MGFRGIVRGGVIEIEGPLPFAEGEAVELEVQRLASPRIGSAAALLEAIRQPPHLAKEDVDEMERLINEKRLPHSDPPLFEDEPLQ